MFSFNSLANNFQEEQYWSSYNAVVQASRFDDECQIFAMCDIDKNPVLPKFQINQISTKRIIGIIGSKIYSKFFHTHCEILETIYNLLARGFVPTM